MFGEEGFMHRPPCPDTWYEESGAMDPERLKDITQNSVKTDRFLDFICDRGKDRAKRQEMLLSLDETHAFSESNIPGEILLDIWESDDVSRYWKAETLTKVMKMQFYGVNVVPLEFQRIVAFAMVRKEYDAMAERRPGRGCVLKMLHEGEFERLDAFAADGRLGWMGSFPGIWGQMLFHVLMLADYDSATAPWTSSLRPAVEWIERFAPGTAASAADRLGNTALIYLHATLTVTNPSYLSRTRDGIEMAADDGEFLKSLGCNARQENIFGVSYSMLKG